MYNPSQIPLQTLGQFEIIGAFVVNVFRNDLHEKSTNAFTRNPEIGSVTNAYRAWVPQEISKFEDKKHVERIMSLLYGAFVKHSSNYTPDYIEWINTTTKEFVPDMYFSHMSTDYKSRTLVRILRESMTDFSKFIMETGAIKYIIDERNPTTLIILQNKMIDILDDQQKLTYKIFYNQVTKDTKRDRNQILMNSRKYEIKNLVAERDALKQYTTKLIECNRNANKTIMTQNQELEHVIKRCQELYQSNEKLKKIQAENKFRYGQYQQPADVPATPGIHEELKRSLSKIVSDNNPPEVLQTRVDDYMDIEMPYPINDPPKITEAKTLAWGGSDTFGGLSLNNDPPIPAPVNNSSDVFDMIEDDIFDSIPDSQPKGTFHKTNIEHLESEDVVESKNKKVKKRRSKYGNKI